VNLRRWVVGLLVALTMVSGVVARSSRPPVVVKIIAFNDFHGNLLSPGSYVSAAGPVRVGGIDYLAAYVAQLEGRNPNHVVVHAGDLVGASPLISSFHHDEATIEAMNLLGLDVAAVGNHEFDAGPDELLRKQAGGCHAERDTCLEDHAFPGAAFKYLAANVVSASGKTIFPPYVIKTFQGVRVALIGVGLTGTPKIVTPAGVAGLTFKDEADAVNALIPELHARGVNAIVVLVHQGGVQKPGAGPAAGLINECAGLLGDPVASPILDVVSRLSDSVDLVISGHTHKAYNCRLPNSVGRAIPVTQAGDYGRLLTDIDVTIDRVTGHVTDVTATNRWIDHAAADSPTSPVFAFLSSAPVLQIRKIVGDYRAAVAPFATRVVGSMAAPLTNVPAANGEIPAGDFIADTELAATAAADGGGAVVAFLNGGGVRGSGFDFSGAYPHDVTYEEAFAVRPFGNSLVTMTLTAQNLKDLLEQQFAGCMGQTGNRILQVSNGFHFAWRAAAAPCQKVIDVSLRPADGRIPHALSRDCWPPCRGSGRDCGSPDGLGSAA
jgi:5'-nucleotidase